MEHPHLLPVRTKRGIRSKDPNTARSGIPDGDQGLDMAAQGLKREGPTDAWEKAVRTAVQLRQGHPQV